jgi:hypothetical protein
MAQLVEARFHAGTFPDLSALPPGCLRSQLRAAWPDRVTPDSLLFELVRLAEKALWDYNAARAHHVRLVDRGEIVNAMGCADRLEDCINATDRGYRSLKVIIKQRPEPPVGLPHAVTGELRLNKTSRRALRRVQTALHGEPQLPAGARLFFDQTHVCVGSDMLAYSDLERLVRTLHTLVAVIVAAQV